MISEPRLVSAVEFFRRSPQSFVAAHRCGLCGWHFENLCQSSANATNLGREARVLRECARGCVWHFYAVLFLFGGAIISWNVGKRSAIGRDVFLPDFSADD